MGSDNSGHDPHGKPAAAERAVVVTIIGTVASIAITILVLKGEYAGVVFATLLAVLALIQGWRLGFANSGHTSPKAATRPTRATGAATLATEEETAETETPAAISERPSRPSLGPGTPPASSSSPAVGWWSGPSPGSGMPADTNATTNGSSSTQSPSLRPQGAFDLKGLHDVLRVAHGWRILTMTATGTADTGACGCSSSGACPWFPT